MIATTTIFLKNLSKKKWEVMLNIVLKPDKTKTDRATSLAELSGVRRNQLNFRSNWWIVAPKPIPPLNINVFQMFSKRLELTILHLNPFFTLTTLMWSDKNEDKLGITRLISPFCKNVWNFLRKFKDHTVRVTTVHRFDWKSD